MLGRVTVTLSPTATSVYCEASNATCTWRVVVVACITVWPVWVLPPNSWDDRAFTRTAVASNTAWPSVSVPFWVTPRAAWSFSKTVVVAEPKEAGSWAELSRGGIAERDQIRVELGHVGAGRPGR